MTYTPTPEQVEAAARAIDPSAWRLRDSGTFPLDHPASTSVVIDSQEKATAALTAAGPLIERAVVDRLEALARELDALTITHQAENYATVLRIKREGVMEAIRRVRGDADD